MDDDITEEEIFKQHREEIDAMFEEHGFFRRVGDMFKGFKCPKSSREYKIARTELQRLVAPLVAILLPVIGVVILIVVTAVSGQVTDHITVDVAQLQDNEAELEDAPDPPEEEIDMTQDIDVTVEVQTDVPTPDMAAPAPPAPDPGGEPNKVAAAPSPVTMSAVSGSVKMRGLGDGASGGFGTLIGGGGKSQNIEGCLIGIIIDFKRDSAGNPRPTYVKTLDGKNWFCPNYWNDAKLLLEKNFSPEALSNFFVPSKRVALSHLFITVQDAANGPKAFGVEKVMESSGFVAYYSGKIKSTEKARYRFVGYFDDLMVVRINRKVVFEDNWGSKAKGTAMRSSGWASSSPDNGKWPSMQKMSSPMTVGDWFDVVPGKELYLEIMCGECPGGKIGGVLLIQKDGVQYEMADGHPVLPVFASRPLSYKEKENIRSYFYKISADSPRFNSRGTTNKAQREMTRDDVSVQVDI